VPGAVPSAGGAAQPGEAAQPGRPGISPVAAGVPGLDLGGRRAVVTGGANGIGAACARPRPARAGPEASVPFMPLLGATGP
jgi:hypothetical protein